ncbi:11591_t:CDS:2 [Racocetra fulgida]|uniref:11591_t:CDS:1 n=1 Tax=Racocetra fulgida TaxID=60492 RepID=A0A9N9AIY6_9GLOM|nr:11591_t:CDS:2 [Racocetra fulgida]
MAEIEHAVVYSHCDAHMIRNLLQPKFPDQLFLTQDLSNAIQKIKRDKKAFLNDETQESYEWVLQQTLDATSSEPNVFITDMDSAMNAAFSSSSSMIDVIEAIDFWMQKEALNASFITWKYKSLIYHQPFIIEKLFSNIEELIQKHLSCRIIEELKNQIKLIGNFKKALNYLMEDNDQKNLNELILSYIARKEKKWKVEAQSVIIKGQALNNNNIVRLVDSRIYDADNIQDPIAHQGKAFTEENNKTSTSNTKHTNSSNREKGIEVSSIHRCHLCHETEHYAPKCPNQEN